MLNIHCSQPGNYFIIINDTVQPKHKDIRMKKSKLTTRSLAIITLSALILACSNSGPGTTAEKFMTHLAKAEFTEAKQYASKPTGELVEMMGKMGAALGGKMNEEKDFNFILEEEKVEGDKATVKFRKKDGGKIETVHLIKAEGDWKVHEEKK